MFFFAPHHLLTHFQDRVKINNWQAEQKSGVDYRLYFPLLFFWSFFFGCRVNTDEEKCKTDGEIVGFWVISTHHSTPLSPTPPPGWH